MAKTSEYRIPGVTGFNLGDGNMVKPDKDGIFHLSDAQLAKVKTLGYKACAPNEDVEQPGSKPMGSGVDNRPFPKDPNQTDAKPGKPTPREEVAKMTGAMGHPASKYPADSVTVYPDGENKKKKVVVVSIVDGDDIVNPNLTGKQATALLGEYGLTSKQVNASKSPWVSEPEGGDGDGELRATIYPLAGGDKDNFDVVLDDGDGEPEVHTHKSEKQVIKILKEAGLDPSNENEVTESDEPYLPPEE